MGTSSFSKKFSNVWPSRVWHSSSGRIQPACSLYFHIAFLTHRTANLSHDFIVTYRHKSGRSFTVAVPSDPELHSAANNVHGGQKASIIGLKVVSVQYNTIIKSTEAKWNNDWTTFGQPGGNGFVVVEKENCRLRLSKVRDAQAE